MDMSIYKAIKVKILNRIKVPLLSDFLAIIFIFGFFLKKYIYAYLVLPRCSSATQNEARALLYALCPVPPQPEIIALRSSTRYDLSIIVPVYNASSFIGKCIESVLAQETRYSFQIVIINDGSTDDSENILSTYNSQENVKVINQENYGISAARNRGLEAAESELIMFLDADDLLLPGAIEALVAQQRLSNSDVVVGGFSTFTKSEELSFSLTNSFQWDVLDREKAWFKVSDGFPWGKVYRKQLWESVRFPVGYQFEDTIIKGLIFRLASKISYTTTQVVAYRQHGASITKKLKAQPNSVIFVLWAVEFVLDANKRLMLENDLTLGAFLQSHLTKIVLMRAKYLNSSTLGLVFTFSRALIRNYPDILGQSSAQANAFKALAEGNFKAWYFWSSIATLEA